MNRHEALQHIKENSVPMVVLQAPGLPHYYTVRAKNGRIFLLIEYMERSPKKGEQPKSTGWETLHQIGGNNIDNELKAFEAL